MDFSSIKTGIDAVARFINLTHSVTAHAKSASYADLAKLTTVEPLTIVSPDCMNLEYMPAIAQACQSLYASYYLQTFDILANLNSIETVKTLEKLNPNRDSTGFLLIDDLKNRTESNSFDAMQYGLPTKTHKLRTEAFDSEGLHDTVNLAVGRMYDVSMSTKDVAGVAVTNKLRVAIRLMPLVANNSTIMAVLGQGTVDSTWSERIRGILSGRLSAIRDGILCQDLIDERMKAAIQDDMDLGVKIHQRVSTNRKFGVLTNNPSLATASNIVVIPEDVAAQLEYKAGKLSDYNSRQKIFESGYAMILVVVNRVNARVTFYVRGQADYAVLNRKDIEGYAKGKGPDVMEMLRAMQTASFSSF